MRVKVFASLLVLLVLLSGEVSTAPTAHACSCFPSPPQEALKQAEAVFVGRVGGVKQQRQPWKEGGTYLEHTITLGVESQWKGISSPQVSVVIVTDYIDSQGLSVIGCEDHNLFVVGESFVVYAYRDNTDGKLHTHFVCGRTKALTAAKEDIAALGNGKPVGSKIGTDPFSSAFMTLSIVNVLILGVVLIWKRLMTP